MDRAPRAEKGAGKIEYGALVLMVATLVAALTVFNLPTDVRRMYEIGLCRITGDDEDCDEAGSGGEQAGGGDGGGGSGSDTDGGGSADGEDEGGGDQEETEDPPADAETIVYDPGAAQALIDAHGELAEAKEAKEDAESEYASLDDELMGILLDLMGVEDARKCLTEGDIVACLWTVVGFTPWGKGAKLVKKAPKIIKLFSRWRKLKKAKDAALKRFDKAKDGTRDAVGECKAGKPRRSAYGASAFGGPVVLSDGTELTLVHAAPAAGDGEKKPTLEELLAEADKPSKPAPSLEELLAGTEGTVCANPDPGRGPDGKPGELKGLHSEKAMKESTLKALRKQSTDEIVDSLKPGGEEALIVKPDGTIMNGNHRIRILQERGYDVDGLPREIYRSDLPDDGFWE
ncbi:hypothetical protein [Nocardiopsis potens]|uniref:hypothetical protein n=1 Tax=Nocardiopsis potens TaxID=1246458 RepID=UPI000345F528|nr:hypothetical protein [Nocardiopsis potens]